MVIEVKEPIPNWEIGDMLTHHVYMFPSEGALRMNNVINEISNYMLDHFDTTAYNHTVTMNNMVKTINVHPHYLHSPFNLDVVMWKNWQNKELGHSVIRFIVFPTREQWDENVEFKNNIVEYEQ